MVVRRAKSLCDVLADGSLFLQRLLLLHAHHVCIPATEQHRQSIKQNTYSLTSTMYREIIVIVTKMYVEFATEIFVFLSRKYFIQPIFVELVNTFCCYISVLQESLTTTLPRAWCQPTLWTDHTHESLWHSEICI